MPTSSPTPASPAHRHVSPVGVALFAWLVPGGGYIRIGMAWRGFAVLVSVVFLFIAGILIGGIRVMDPPGYDDYGYMTQVASDSQGRETFVQPQGPGPVTVQNNLTLQGPALYLAPITEIGLKPWYVGQILCGPMTLAASALANVEAHPVAGSDPLVSQVPPALSHSWELGALYTAVAGMLNLMAIIDSVYRAGHEEPEQEEAA